MAAPFLTGAPLLWAPSRAGGAAARGRGDGASGATLVRRVVGVLRGSANLDLEIGGAREPDCRSWQSLVLGGVFVFVVCVACYWLADGCRCCFGGLVTIHSWRVLLIMIMIIITAISYLLIVGLDVHCN